MNSTLKDRAIIWAIAFVIVAIFFAFIPKVELGNFKENNQQSYTSIISTTTSADDISADEFHDYAPMSIPTKWNNLAQMFNLPKTSTWTTTEIDENAFIGDEIKISPFLERENATKRNMLIFMRSAFSGYGKIQKDIDAKELGFISITDMQTGKIVLEKQLPKHSSTPQIAIAEFLLRKSKGIAQIPLLKKSSGNDATDNILSQTVKNIQHTLPDGNYNVQIIQ